MITAVNPEYNAKIKRAYNHYRKYHELVNLESSCETDKEIEKLERQQEKAYNKYTDIIEELPKREQSNFEAQHKTIHGYS